ncbi:MAG: UDP-N-acetylglucosamine 1-carboxyvinyltransferase, partial [Clostridiaceae bacterium]|nr:UDP-N-acetylglucosamine 1-carboxyvinyltransferase [Clostridiaceae bacterium]
LLRADGISTITEGIFENRFQYIEELKRMGANIRVEGRMAVVEGGSKLSGAPIKALDLRAGAACVIAALIAEGETELSNVHYLDRGYENIVEKFGKLGADIRRISDNQS